jgi:SAM-dependent methyltransferase
VDTKDLYRANRELWQAWTRIHERSDYYRLSAFKQGESALGPVEREELGALEGTSILHLQCHFGMETLSLARLGARVTGIDFSSDAIALARSLAGELGLEADFVCGDVFDAPALIPGAFDIVFVSYGSVMWIEDLNRYCRIAASFLKPGGFFYLVELHPFLNLLDERGEHIVKPYFRSREPIRLQWQGTYAAPDADFAGVSYIWHHSIADILNGLIQAGLRISSFHERSHLSHDCYPFLEEYEPGRFARHGKPGQLPHVFSVKATREKREGLP